MYFVHLSHLHSSIVLNHFHYFHNNCFISRLIVKYASPPHPTSLSTASHKALESSNAAYWEYVYYLTIGKELADIMCKLQIPCHSLSWTNTDSPDNPLLQKDWPLGIYFPGTAVCFVFGLFWVVTVEALPWDPWPMHIAGLPLYVTCYRIWGSLGLGHTG